MCERVLDILFIGDIVGRPGRKAVCRYLNDIKNTEPPDFVIANVENASHGFGLTFRNHEELKSYGINAFTSGNHIWDKKEIFEYINTSDVLIRPLNYPNCDFGVGYRIFEVKGVRLCLINLLGRTFMTPVDSPFDVLKNAMPELKEKADIFIADFHAEATAEKICMAYFAKDLGINAVLGTHTHVQTADEQIMDNMFYITDVGFCGAKNSVIGMDVTTSIKRLLTCLPERYEIEADNEAQLNAVRLKFDISSKSCMSIERIFCDKKLSEEKDMKGS
ncbi:MAG: TIGR00282 family metallophosphoesterase [Candidatus Gastranaerophilales bacterium]|nr:TIGR00282 family metallophosphoesterase [Candidatus Gastranaerophilales bacterium]